MDRVLDQLNDTVVNCRIDADYAYIVDLADMHIGSMYHHEKLARFVIDQIRRVPETRVIIGGDVTESNSLTSKGSIYDESCHGIDQIIKARDMLWPIRKQILCVRSGNHGLERALRSGKLIPEQILSEFLGVPFFRGTATAMVNVRKNTYVVAAWHHGKKPEDSLWLDADIHFFEHKHLKHKPDRVVRAVPNKYSKKWMVRDSVIVQAGSFLAWGGYAIDKGYKPTITGCPVVEMCGIPEQWGTTVFERITDFQRFIVDEREDTVGREKDEERFTERKANRKTKIILP